MHPLSEPEALCRRFSLSDIISATDNFSSNLIGYVYKGTIVLVPGNTTTVAVKRRSFDSKQGLVEFWTEVKLLSKCRHAHLISLIGYCLDHDANEMILVYEYMSNGTLADHIYKKNEKSVFLSWEQRLKICIGIGRGLEYLHTGTGINQAVIHRDLKGSNVLLDENWEPKISDFGLCKRRSNNLQPGIPVIASIKGTRGYMDPHYCKMHELSTKTDVYAVGVVLLEVLCGRRSLDFSVADRQKRLVVWAAQCIREGVAYRVIDPGLRGCMADDGLRIFLDITLRCLEERPKKRPALAEVVGKLEIALASQYTTYSSSFSVDGEIFEHFNQVAYSSTSANSYMRPSRHTVEAGSDKSDSVQDPGSEMNNAMIDRKFSDLKSSCKKNDLEVTVDLQSTRVKANVPIAATSKAYIRSCNDNDDVYEKLFRKINPLSVVIDNESCNDATIIQVNGIYRHEILLEVVQLLTDMNFIFTRASMTLDGLWSMNVFRVTDLQGNKITDEKILDYIQEVIGSDTSFTGSIKSVGLPTSEDLTVIELIGTDRPGLLSEVCTVLLDLRCNVVKLHSWTHNTRAAFVILLADQESGAAITDPMRLYNIKKMLCDVLSVSNNDEKGANIAVTHGIHTERRLHQMMMADGDYERGCDVDLDQSQRTDVSVVNWYYKKCSVVTIRCPDRPKLLFDTICTLTDMGYAVLHGHVNFDRTEAFQEYCIRYMDGLAVQSDFERQRVIHCIKAAIEQRVYKDLRLELCTLDRIGLLSGVTRVIRENSLMVTRAEVETQGDKAIYAFYVRDASGYSVDSKIIHSISTEIGVTILEVKHNPQDLGRTPRQSPGRYLFGSLYNLGIKQFANIKINFFL